MTQPLTVNDIRALKAARDVYATIDRNGNAALAAHGPRNTDATWTSTDAPRRDVPCMSTVRVASHDSLPERYTVFEHVGGSYDAVWATVVGCMRVGDVLDLEVVADGLGGGKGDNGYLSMACITEQDSKAKYDAEQARHREYNAQAIAAGREPSWPHTEPYYSHATPLGGLHADVVYLTIRRLSERDKLMGRNGHTFTFMLAVSICPDNTARTIRPSN